MPPDEPPRHSNFGTWQLLQQGPAPRPRYGLLPMVLFTFALFTGFVAVVTILLTRRDDHASSTGYFLAGRRLTGPVIAGSLLLTNLSTEQMVGLNGAAFADGFAVMAWEVVAGLSLVLMALFFLPRFLKSGIATVPQYLEIRFDKGARSITTMIFLAAYAGILLPIILYTGARGLDGILDMEALTGIESETGRVWLAVWVVGILGSLYALFGGLRTVAISDTLNGIGLLVGGMLIAYYGLMKVGGDQGIAAGFAAIQEAHPERLNSIGGAESSVPFGTLFTGVLLLNLFYWCTNQQIIQRTLGASSLREGQKGVLFCGLLKLLGPIYLVLPGIIAYQLYAGTDIHKDVAYGTLVRDVLPEPLTGFFLAVMVGAILSSFNSALNSTTTLFSLGIYKGLVRPDATEQQVVRRGKTFGWILAIAAMLLAPQLVGQDSIFGYLQKMNGLYFIPIFAVVVVGMLTKRVPAVAAKVALVVGFVAIALGYFVPALSEGMARAELHEFHFLGIVFASLIVLQLAIGAIWPRSTPFEQQPSGDVDLTPWALARPVGLVIVALVLTIYLSFADLSVL